MRHIFGRDLGPQLWTSNEPPVEENFRSIKGGRNRLVGKPFGGMWTSTYVNGESDWIRWCREESYAEWDDESRWILTPNDEAAILEIHEYDDLAHIMRNYPARVPPVIGHDIDFIAMRDDGWDALHLTEEGQWNTRLTHPYNLYGWDCESTLWLRWSFNNVEHVLPQIGGTL